MDTALPHIEALRRHFADLRDGTHGTEGDTVTREGKENHFRRAVELLHPYADQVLEEVNATLLLGTGEAHASGLLAALDGGLVATWTLSWPEQRETEIGPITLIAYFGRGFHHPHLRGATVHDWPLNVFTPEQAAAEVPVLRAIATADLHNLVFQRDYRIVPEISVPQRQGGAQ
ncbi:hypothetical protein [Sphaerimonospora thailandensis]|uniref:Uncharacterized protein n=1 Tax=Sphaerimonospora thailandensis TaxID=795644 RepID=A0A8J3W2A5_9ACTN|nr:hypothetical protein [Sphaerimonospora thailandensis]GIH72586.1 hypothetical protein Mth01_48390 [Sphaerimonospora thailandensis]